MKDTGIVRRIDELGRVVIPKEIRKTLRMKEGESLEICTDGDAVLLKKYSLMNNIVDFAEDYVDALAATAGEPVVICDCEKVVAESKARSLEDYPVSDELHKVLNARRPVILDETKKIDFNGIESNSQIIRPIISDSELVGGVILFPKSVGNEKVMLKLCECAAKFIGSQV